MADKKIYIIDPSYAPKGANVVHGPRGGLYYVSNGLKPMKAIKPKVEPKPKKAAGGGKGKAPAKAKPEKRQPGQKFTGIDDPNLPGPVKLESDAVKKQWVDAFNKSLDDGGSDADALHEAKKVLPTRDAKPPKDKKPTHTTGNTYSGADDSTLPSRIRQESTSVRADWTKTFNDTVSGGGSEADAIAAANKKLPDRSTKTPPKVKTPKRSLGSSYSGADDPQLPTRVRSESSQVRTSWTNEFNATLKRGGSEADATAAANKKLPDRTPPKPAKTTTPKKKEFAMETLALVDEDTFDIIDLSDMTVTKDDGSTPVQRAMVALFPRSGVADIIALEDKTGLGTAQLSPADELHITLAYYPEVDADEVMRLVQNVAMVASNTWHDLETEVEGIARFNSVDDKTGLVPLVLLFDPTALAPIHDMLAANPLCSSKHGFIPHMTLAYVPTDTDFGAELPPNLELAFDKMTLVIGDNMRFDFDLGMDIWGAPTAYSYREAREQIDSEPSSSDDVQQLPSVVSQTTGEGMDLVLEAEKATWTTAFVNDLPDSAFLYVESGEKDSDGKTTPRSNRHFPYKDADGKIDLPHLRNAIARIPQANIPADKKTSLQKRAQSLLGEQSKEGKRIRGSMKAKLSTAIDALKELFNFAEYDDSASMDTMKKELEQDSQFLVFKDASGADRWLAFSGNAFEDRESEIISTDAIIGSVERVEAKSIDGVVDAGPLRIWHIPGEIADIGDCDFQAVEGRVLIESGTFRNDEVSVAAKSWLTNTDMPLGISIAFRYPKDEFDGRVYKEIHIFERSVLPLVSAANPWTDFVTLKGEGMKESQIGFLRSMLGDTLADGIVAKANTATKELEGRVAFKDDSTSDALKELQTSIDASSDTAVKNAFSEFLKKNGAKGDGTDDGTDGGADSKKKKEDESATAATTAEPVAATAAPLTTEQITAALAEVITPIAEVAMKAVNLAEANAAALKEMQEEQTKAKENSSRGSSFFRATEADSTVLTDEKVKQALEGLAEKGFDTGNPASKFVADVVGGRR